MNDDRILEFMALMSDYMRSTDHRFEQLITVMHNGFERVNTQLGTITTELRATNQRVDVLTGRLDVLTNELREVKTDVRDIKTEAQTTSRRLGATFEQAGHLTEENTTKDERLKKLEAANDDTQQRLRTFEEFMRRAS